MLLAIAFAAALQSAPLVHYDDLPNPTRNSVIACRAQYDRLQDFVGNFRRAVFNRELSRGGRLQSRDSSDIRHAADVTARPYFESLRQIAFKGEVAQCRAIADQGIRAVTDDVIMPVFGRRD